MRNARRLDARGDDPTVSAALLRASAELHASLEPARILRHHCSLSRELLECASAHSYLLDARSGSLVLRARSGDSGRGDLTALSRQEVLPLLERLDQTEVATSSEAESPFLERLALELGGRAGMAVALRRGRKMIGLHLTCHRSASSALDATKRRIAHGLARIASLALENARRHEEQARLSRDRFELLSVLSHELREPLHVILGFGGILLDGDLGRLEPQQHDAVRRIARNSRQLADLIENTLCVTRSEATGNRPSTCEMTLPELVAEIRQESLALHTKPNVRLIWDVPSDLPPLAADPARLRMVLRNLVGNAVKFTEEGLVRVALAHRGDGIEFVVADTGPGIPPELHEVIFEPFRQGAGAGRGGVGLGLYIVRRMLGHLGGSIAVASEPGKGSEFRFWVPLDARQGPDGVSGRSAQRRRVKRR